MSGGDKPRSLTFTKSGLSEAVTLNLIVQNGGASGGMPALRFTEESGAVARVPGGRQQWHCRSRPRRP